MNNLEKIKDLKDKGKIDDKEELQLELLNQLVVCLSRLNNG